MSQPEDLGLELPGRPGQAGALALPLAVALEHLERWGGAGRSGVKAFI